MRKTKTIEYRDDELTVRLTVAASTIERGTDRTIRRVEAQAALEGQPGVTPARRVLQAITYPDALAATVAVEGLPWPLDFETFAALPEELGEVWLEAVYELNPRWLQRLAEEGKKNSATSSTGD